jgi:peptidoglycan/xylan/chitin deacetylase (PgdA/CDA1 family)
LNRVGLAPAAMLILCGAAPKPEIAVTIDDLPVHAPYPPGVTPLAVNVQMIGALKAAHVPVTAFVNAVNVKDRGTMAALRAWRQAGFVLGNHTWSHPHLSELTMPAFEGELTRGEPVLSRLGGHTNWHWFRYPFLDEGKDAAQRLAARQVLATHGYKVADVTTTFSDWAWTPAYARCTAKHDRSGVQQLERLYLAAVRQSIADDRETAHKLYGRDISYVLLMHVSAMSAHMMPQVLSIYRQSGYRFVSLPQAERDPVYRSDIDLSAAPAPSRGELAKSRGVRLPAPPDYSAKLDAMCA